MRVTPLPSDQSRMPRDLTSGKSNDSLDVPGSERAKHNSRGRLAEFILILSISLATAALATHVLVHWLGIRSGGVGYKIVGSTGAPPTALAEGSSLMRDAISWQEVSNTIGATIENWFAAGGSP